MFRRKRERERERKLSFIERERKNDFKSVRVLCLNWESNPCPQLHHCALYPDAAIAVIIEDTH